MVRRFALPIVIAGAMTGGCGLLLGIDDIDGPGVTNDAATPDVTKPKDAGVDTNVAETSVPDTGLDAGFDLSGTWVGKWRQQNGPLSMGGNATLTLVQKGYTLSGSGKLDNSTCFVSTVLEAGQIEGMPRPPEPVKMYGVLTNGNYGVELKANWDGDKVISGTFDTGNMAGPCSGATGTFDGTWQPP